MRGIVTGYTSLRSLVPLRRLLLARCPASAGAARRPSLAPAPPGPTARPAPPPSVQRGGRRRPRRRPPPAHCPTEGGRRGRATAARPTCLPQHSAADTAQKSRKSTSRPMKTKVLIAASAHGRRGEVRVHVPRDFGQDEHRAPAAQGETRKRQWGRRGCGYTYHQSGRAAFPAGCCFSPRACGASLPAAHVLPAAPLCQLPLSLRRLL